jgi:tRNA(Ile)-lysidine synthase
MTERRNPRRRISKCHGRGREIRVPILARRAEKMQNGRVSELLHRVESEIQSRRLLLRGQRILVAVSGGVDSMVLLHVLHSLAAGNRWQISVAHFNHRLRGRASEADERLVRKTAAALKLRMVAESADVKSFAAKCKLSLEMAARKLRHEFLARVARKQKIKTIAFAHHADDQVELFFLRLLRGAGGEGLAGMKWQSPSPANRAISLIRPLLDFPKAELLAFARENKIPFRDDATNFSSDFLRNRIRNELLPLLRTNYQPGLDKAVLRLMEIVGAEAEFVGEAAQRWLASFKSAPLPVWRGEGEKTEVTRRHSFSPPKREEGGRRPDEGIFNSLPISIQRRVLQSQLAEAGIAPDFELIESLRQSADCFVSVGPKFSVSRDKSGKIKSRMELKLGFSANELVVNLLNWKREAIFDRVKFRWQIGSRGRSLHHAQKEFFDADKVGGEIILRHWRPGDRFQPIGLKSAAKLQDLFVNAKIPAARRRKLVLATTADREIFWVEGLRIGERFKLTPQTRQTLVWKWSTNLAV